MDINPLIADLNKFKVELIASIQIAVAFNKVHLADRYVARDIAEIKGEQQNTNDPFLQLAKLYHLPREEVVKNIRTFTNKGYKIFLIRDPKPIKDIEFDPIRV